MPRVSSSIVVALERARDCSEVFARAIQCGESLAQPPQRGKKTWESGQGLSKPVDTGGICLRHVTRTNGPADQAARPAMTSTSS
jgi:hypothetical protein